MALSEYPHAYTGTDAVAIPAPTAVGAAGSINVDQTFGSRILRVTDASTASGFSLMPENAGHFRTFNSNATAIKLKNSIGGSWWMEFNPSAFRMGSLHALVGFDYNWEWSAVDPDVFYFLNVTQIAKHNKATVVSTNLNGPSGATLPVSYHTVVSGDDDWVSCAAGAGGQDTWTKIFCVKPNTPTTVKLIDLVAKTINGVSFASDPDWPTATPGQTIGIHGLYGSAGGQYLGCIFHNASWNSNGHAVLDLVTNTWELIDNSDVYYSGHPSIGNREFVNGCGSINNLDSRGAVVRNVSDLMNASSYEFIMQPPSTAGIWYDAEHSSWFNASTTAFGSNPPILFSRYLTSTPPSTLTWHSEIIAAATDGSNTVWRFCHNHNLPGAGFYGQAFAQISNDGKWAAFSSPWGGTLGDSDGGFSYGKRIDTFIVELDRGAPPNDSIVFDWTPSTDDVALGGYIIHAGTMTNGVITYHNTHTVTNAEAVAAGHTITLDPVVLPGSLLVPYDGIWWFAVSSFDTANNHSVKSTPQSKRVIRVRNRIKVRK